MNKYVYVYQGAYSQNNATTASNHAVVPFLALVITPGTLAPGAEPPWLIYPLNQHWSAFLFTGLLLTQNRLRIKSWRNLLILLRRIVSLMPHTILSPAKFTMYLFSMAFSYFCLERLSAIVLKCGWVIFSCIKYLLTTCHVPLCVTVHYTPFLNQAHPSSRRSQGVPEVTCWTTNISQTGHPCPHRGHGQPGISRHGCLFPKAHFFGLLAGSQTVAPQPLRSFPSEIWNWSP